MPDNITDNVKTDSEFERLIQPYSDKALSETIRPYQENRNIRFPVYFWQAVLLSPVDLYQKLLDENISIQICDMDFNSKLEAIIFVCMKQLERKDLTNSYYKYLVGEGYLTEYLRANFEKETSKFQSAMKLATPLKIASGTVLKYGEYAKAIDTINTIEPKLVDYMLNERVRISHNNTLELARIPRENIKRVLDAVENNGVTKVTYEDMRFETQYNPPKGLRPSKVVRSEETDEKLAIRQMPAYDPDAQVSSLALTVPSWSSSIDRVTESTNFSKISNAARNRLMRSLNQLNSSIELIKLAIEEE